MSAPNAIIVRAVSSNRAPLRRIAASTFPANMKATGTASAIKTDRTRVPVQDVSVPHAARLSPSVTPCSSGPRAISANPSIAGS